MKMFIVILCALFVDVAYSGMYDLFGVVHHEGKPVGGAILLDEKRAMTAYKFKELEGCYQIKFGFRKEDKFTCNIVNFEEFSEEFNEEIVVANIDGQIPASFKDRMPAKFSFIEKFQPSSGVQILDWSINQEGLIVLREKTSGATRVRWGKELFISNIDDCKNGKFVGCPVFQSDEFVGIALACVSTNLYWKHASNPDVPLTCSEPVDVKDQEESSKQSP